MKLHLYTYYFVSVNAQESYGILADIPPYMRNFEWLSYNAPYFFPFFNSYSEVGLFYSPSYMCRKVNFWELVVSFFGVEVID